MYSIKKLTDAQLAAGTIGEASEIRLIFPFDLSQDGTGGRTEGSVCVAGGMVYAVSAGAVAVKEELSHIESFALVRGIGCVSLEYKTADGTERMLCRGSGEYVKLFTEALGDLNFALEGKYSDDIPMYHMGNACPKCGRPLTPGSEECAACKTKGSYISRLWALAAPWRGMIILSVVLHFVCAAINLINPYLNGLFADEYINGENPVLGCLIAIIVSMLAASLLNQAVSVVRSLLLIDAGARFTARLRQLVFDKAQALSMSKISKRTSGELINRVSGDPDVISNFITNSLGDMIRMGVMLLAVGSILFIYDWRIALLVLCPMPIILVINNKLRHFMFKYFRLAWTTTSKASSVLHDTFSGIRVVKSFGTEKREIKRHEEATAKERDVSIKSESISGGLMPPMAFLMGIGEFFIMYFVGARILDGTMTIGTMVQFSSYVSLIYEPLRWISRLPMILSRTGTSISKIFDIIDEENEVTDTPNALEPSIDGEIIFDNVSFSYDAANPVLKNVSATVKKGEMIGIVGRSGVGKSTLINLVMRMYDPESGSVKVDGIDLRDMKQEALRSQIGVVLQETFLFSGSVYDNIRYAKADATKDEVIAAAKLAGAHKFIVKLPNGYNTKIGERGHTLSGGERQRVSIARALLRNPRILILDEATSALDTETEKEVQDVLYKLTRGRTTLAIAHRLSTLRNADKILVLDHGSVAEFGPHDELMKQKGIYFNLVMAQRQMSRIKK